MTSCCFNLCLFSSDYAALWIHFRTAKCLTSPSLSHDLFFSCPSLSVIFVSLFNCSRQRIAKSLTQKQALGKESGYTVPERSATPTQYMALALRRVSPFFLDIYIYINPRAQESQFQWCRARFARQIKLYQLQ